MPEERNYHIFYCMLAGLTKEHKAKLELKDATHYKYLTGVSRESPFCLQYHGLFHFRLIWP